ncbi:DNA-binding transcriptional regulator Fis [Gilvimarinus japonicus]|jgi:Fis family transcriptional regulator|uniref:Putative Fis-like DNA-binding protein n=2 Tax=Gilvimarinus TaxID=940550 RepID=A0ABV7HMP5_9GAMM
MNSVETFITDASMTPKESLGAQPQQAPATQAQSLRGSVEQAMENYFQHLDGQPVSNVYDMVMAEVEAPLLEVVLKYTRHNQTRAAQALGLNRGTLRKKLKQYGLL